MRTVFWIFLGIIILMGGYLAYEYWWPEGTGSLVVMSDPPGAQVWIDLQPTSAVTNAVVAQLKAGQHSITVRKDTLEADPFAVVVFTHPGQTDTVQFQLVKPSVRLSEQMAAQKSYTPPPAIALPPKPQDVLPPVNRDSFFRLEKPPVSMAAPIEPPSPRREESASSGLVEISSTLLGARVYIDDSLQADLTPVNKRLAPGTYTVRVEMDGYIPDPRDQTVLVTRSSATQFVFFTLKEDQAAHRQIVIETIPVSGLIFVDSVKVGDGKAVVPRDFGQCTVSFGDMDGYRTPQPVLVSLTPNQPRSTVKGTYVRIFHVAVQADGDNRVKTEGEVRWNAGIFMDGRAQPNTSLGPRIREIPGTQKFGWELAAGDANRNPVGGDYVEFIFDLPPDVAPDAALGLRLYLYRSARRYPLSTSNNSDIIITVNGRKFLDGYRPIHAVTVAEYDRFEEWSLQGMLKAGENRVMIRTSDDNTLYHHLWRFEIRQ
jgi:hypothetical protein